MNTSAKGRRNEHRTIEYLESFGYRSIRSAGSFGPFDGVGIGAVDIVLWQAKTNTWPSTNEIEIIRDFVAPANARKMIFRWRDRQRLPDVKEV